MSSGIFGTCSTDRARFDAHDREATRQQAIQAATRCFVMALICEFQGDLEKSERYVGYLRDLIPVIAPGAT